MLYRNKKTGKVVNVKSSLSGDWEKVATKTEKVEAVDSTTEKKPAKKEPKAKTKK